MSPGEAIKEELAKRGWGQEELSRVMKRPIGRVNEIIQGKQAVTAEIAVQLANVFGNDAEDWMLLESRYRLAQVRGSESTSSAERKLARLYEIAPIKDMVKRGWIKPAESTEALEREVLNFFGTKSLDETPCIQGAMRNSRQYLSATPAQLVWGIRVRKVAAAIPSSAIERYDESKMEECRLNLRKLAAFSSEVRKVPALLAHYGIRLVVIEGLPGAKMTGFATWLDELSPVIGISLKFDRLDSFWFTVGHEWVHVKYRDAAHIDTNIGGMDDDLLAVQPPMERRANEEAADIFVPRDALESFIRRVGPNYSTARINQFANTIKMHPSIIIGQLKHRNEIPQTHHNKPTYPVREAVVKAAVSDGFGKSLFPGAVA